MSSLFIGWQTGNVFIDVMLDDIVTETHTMTPTKAREMARGLLRSADRAEGQLPALSRAVTDPGVVDPDPEC